MNGGKRAPGDVRVYRIVGISLMLIIFAAVCLFFVRTLVFDKPISSRALDQSLIAAGVAVTICCLIAWLLDILDIHTLRKGWARFLWVALIASILGNSALAYKRFGHGASNLQISCFKPLAEGDDAEKIKHPYELRPNAIYAQGGRIAFFAPVTGLSVDENGNYDAEWVAALEDRRNGLARFVTDTFKGNAKNLQEAEGRAQRLERFREIAGQCVPTDDPVIFAPSAKFRTETFTPGTYHLRWTIFDRVSGTYAAAETGITLKMSAPGTANAQGSAPE